MENYKDCICIKNIWASEVYNNVTDDYILFRLGKKYKYSHIEEDNSHLIFVKQKVFKDILNKCDQYRCSHNYYQKNDLINLGNIGQDDFDNIFVKLNESEYKYNKPTHNFDLQTSIENTKKVLVIGDAYFSDELIFKKGEICEYYVQSGFNPHGLEGSLPYLYVTNGTRNVGYPMWHAKLKFKHYN